MSMVTILAVATLAAPAAGSSEAPVDRVVIYADRAEVTRRTTVSCSADRARALFPLLPAGLDVRTLRASASGRARAVGTSSRPVTREQNLDQRAAELQQRIRRLDQQIRVVDEQRGLLDKRLATLFAYQNYFVNLASESMRNARPDTGRWSQVLEFLRTQRLDGVAKTAGLAVQRRQFARQRELLQRRLAHLAPARTRSGLEVEVAVECRGESTVGVSLSYVVAGATWKPEYDLRFLPGGRGGVGPGRLELGVSVVVRQSTGEDWENARLLLSTAKPRLGAETPYPARLTVYARETGKEKVLVEATERRESLAGSGGQVSTRAPSAAALEDRGQSFALVMPRRVTVRSDGRPYWMPLDRASARARARLVAVPKLRPAVFQVVKFRNPAPYPLLAGRAHVFRRGSFVGDVSVKYTAPGEPVEVSLGPDGRFRVERREIGDKDRGPGFLSSTKHIERAFRILVQNNSRSAQTVEVTENIPVSKIEDVEVELGEKTSKGYQLDAHRGFVTWKLRLPAGREKGIDLAYTIHLPEDWKVNIRR